MSKKRKAVGIDLGTTFSAVAHIDDYGKPQIIPNADSERITPSVIMFDSASVIVGTLAKQNSVAEPEKIVDFVKREMGKSKNEFKRDFAGKDYSAEELSALILRKLKQDAEKYLATEVTDAVITVPAYFNDAERMATVTAGQLAGFNVLQVINEPTAAALAYGLDKLHENQNVFVFDLGGGTFDVTIMEIKDGGIRVLATNGDHRLGGKDWDDSIINQIAEEFDRVHGDNPLMDLQSYQELQNRAIAAKIQLSSRPRTALVHSFNGKSIKVEMTREDYEELTRHLVERCKTICEIVMAEARMDWPQIDKILLVGGMTRVPSIRSMISAIAGKPLVDTLNPDEAVAVGAAIQSALSLMQEEQQTGERIVNDSTRERYTAPDGALIKITNITSHTLGVVLWDDIKNERYVYPMIRKSGAIPAREENVFGTAAPNMDKIIVQVVEGESTLPEECSPLGLINVEIPPFTPKGTAVQLSYSYNTNQILEVTVSTQGLVRQIEIKRNTGIAPGEIAQARADLCLLEIE